jgi:hypothetical protein
LPTFVATKVGRISSRSARRNAFEVEVEVEIEVQVQVQVQEQSENPGCASLTQATRSKQKTLRPAGRPGPQEPSTAYNGE